MGKNKKRQSNKRNAKALKRRTEAKKAKGLRTQSKQNARSKAKADEAMMRREIEAWKNDPMGYGFWACHGINYLASDYDEGVWDPPFPAIYVEGSPFPTPEEVQNYIYTMIDPDNPKFTKVGRSLMGYWFAGIEGMYGIAQRAVILAEEAGEDPYGPSQGSVWGLFNEIHTRLQDEMGDKHLAETELAV